MPDLNIFFDTMSKYYLKPIEFSNIKEFIDLPYDRYGFKKEYNENYLTLDEYNRWFERYTHKILESKKKWIVLMKNYGCEIDSKDLIPKNFPPKSKKVKIQVRAGIPSEWRGNAWFYYAGGYERLGKNAGVYDMIIHNTKELNSKYLCLIERDLYRTFPLNIYFNNSIELTLKNKNVKEKDNSTTTNQETIMIVSLRRVLVSFAFFQPNIGYCQSLNFVAGLLLLFMNEEKTFWMLVILTEKIIPNVHSKNLEGLSTDQSVLLACLKNYIPELWSLFGRNMDGSIYENVIISKLPPISLVTSSWFMSLFICILPIETVLRVWDILWYEGSKTIFRISLTICKLCYEQQKKCKPKNMNKPNENTQIEFFQFMQKYPKTFLDPDNLIKMCYKKTGGYGFSSLSQYEINKFRVYFFNQLQKVKFEKKYNVSHNNSSYTDFSNDLNSSDFEAQNDLKKDLNTNRKPNKNLIWNNFLNQKIKKEFSRKHTF